MAGSGDAGGCAPGVWPLTPAPWWLLLAHSFVLPSYVTTFCHTIIFLEILYISVTILFRNIASFAFGEVDL
jgi:hypothetical protein